MIDSAPIPHPPAGQGKKIKSKVEPRKKGRAIGINTWFYFSLSYSDTTGNKLNWFPSVGSVLPMTVAGERSLPAFISAQRPFIPFSLPCPVEEGSDGAALVGTWHSPYMNDRTFFTKDKHDSTPSSPFY